MAKIKASIVIATRNEERTIGKCIESLLNQNYPKNQYEIIFADGRSSDRTREVIKEYAEGRGPKADGPKVILLDNPNIESGSGRNIAIKKARGEFIVQLSGHTVADKNLLKVLVGKLEKADKDVAAVGCTHRTPDDAGFFSKVFGEVMSSYLGGFGTSQIQPTKEQFVDSLSFCAFRKKVLLEVGLNDPKFKVGQDAELNIRIRKAGYKFLYTPQTFVWYYKRPNYPGFFMQMFKYGWGRAKMIKKHPDTSRLIYFGPTIFSLAFIGLVLASIANSAAQLFLVLFLLLYGGAIISSSIRRADSVRFVVAAFFAYWVLHLGYGLGFLYGAIR